MAATIERRLLLNYRADPQVLARLLPDPLRPQQIGGAGVAGICMIRLSGLRPAGAPSQVGIRTENAAHRIAVEWEDPLDGVPRTGVYIPSRHSSSRPTAWLGGRAFPGHHHRAHFRAQESADRIRVGFVGTADDPTVVEADVTPTQAWPGSALFGDLAQASAFFRDSSAGYSVTPGSDLLDGVELRAAAWQVTPVTVEQVRSSFYDDPRRFPLGSISLDGALLMRRVPVTWHRLASMPVDRRSPAAA